MDEVTNPDQDQTATPEPTADTQQQADLELLQSMVDDGPPGEPGSQEESAEEKHKREQLRKITGKLIKPASTMLAKGALHAMKLPTDADQEQLDMFSEATLDTIEHYYPDFDLPAWMGMPITFSIMAMHQAMKKQERKQEADEAGEQEKPSPAVTETTEQPDAMKGVGE